MILEIVDKCDNDEFNPMTYLLQPGSALLITKSDVIAIFQSGRAIEFLPMLVQHLWGRPDLGWIAMQLNVLKPSHSKSHTRVKSRTGGKSGTRHTSSKPICVLFTDEELSPLLQHYGASEVEQVKDALSGINSFVSTARRLLKDKNGPFPEAVPFDPTEVKADIKAEVDLKESKLVESASNDEMKQPSAPSESQAMSLGNPNDDVKGVSPPSNGQKASKHKPKISMKSWNWWSKDQQSKGKR